MWWLEKIGHGGKEAGAGDEGPGFRWSCSFQSVMDLCLEFLLVSLANTSLFRIAMGWIMWIYHIVCSLTVII